MVTPVHRASSARHEYKFLVDEAVAAQVRGHLAAYAEPDTYGAGEAEYPISSLYYDTMDMGFARSTMEGEANRIKLRVRRYEPIGGDPRSATFFEIKRKINGVVLKTRAQVAGDIALRLLEGDRTWLREVDGSARGVIEEFFDLALRYDARPVVNVHYVREAYHSRFGDSARVTFDRHLRATTPSRESPYGSGKGTPTSLQQTVLEVKFNGTCPRWASDMVRRFDLSRRSVPKYVLCLSAARVLGAAPEIRVMRGGVMI